MANLKKTCREIIFGSEDSSRSHIRFWFYGISLFIFLCVVCWAKAARACSPPDSSQLEKDIKNSKNIVVARVVSKAELKDPSEKKFRYKLEVVKNFKGKMKSFTLDLHVDDGGNCGVELTVGSNTFHCLGDKPYFGGCGGFYPLAEDSDPTYAEAKKLLVKSRQSP